MPEALCSAIWKNAADAGVQAPRNTRPTTSPCLRERIAAVLFPCQASGGAQPFQCDHDLAPVAARERRHQRLEGLGTVGERGLDRGEALPSEPRRLGDGG